MKSVVLVVGRKGRTATSAVNDVGVFAGLF
jgi:hypothetical protein